MNNKLMLSLVTTALLLTGCGSDAEISKTSQKEKTVLTHDFTAANSSLKKSLAQFESLQTQNTVLSNAPQRASSVQAVEGFYLGDMVFDLLTEESNAPSQENPTPLYDYFVTNIIDKGLLSEEDALKYENITPQKFYSWFNTEYFEEFGDAYPSFYSPRVLKYLTDLDRSDATRELVKEQLMLVSFDSEVMALKLLNEPRMSSAFLETRKNHPEFENKIVEAFHADDWRIPSKILGFMDYTDAVGKELRDAQHAYHMSHMSKEMYEAMVSSGFHNSILISPLCIVLFNVNKEKTFTLPTNDGVQSFANAFFFFFSEVHGDGNELITERLMYIMYSNMLTYSDMLGSFTKLGEEEQLAYLDFMYLGEVKGKEADKIQAHYNAYARAAGESHLKHGLDFTERLNLLRVEGSMIQSYIPTSRYFDYFKENIVSTYYYYTNEINASEDLKAEEKLAWETSEEERQAKYDAITAKSDTNVTVNGLNNAPQRSTVNIIGGIIDYLEKQWLAVSNYFENFAVELGLIGAPQASSIVIIDGETYELPDTNATSTTSDINNTMGDYIPLLAGSEVDYSSSKYVNYTPYGESENWDYMPTSISSLHWLDENAFNIDQELSFNFYEGEIEVYVVSREPKFERESALGDYYVLEEVVLGSDALSSKNDSSYHVYKFRVKNTDKLTLSELPLTSISGVAFNIRYASFLVDTAK